MVIVPGSLTANPPSDGVRSCPGSPTIKIENEKFCDGSSHCPNATDELNCTCRQLLTNLNPSRICDQIFDCPSLDDEIGCGGNNSVKMALDIYSLSIIP